MHAFARAGALALAFAVTALASGAAEAAERRPAVRKPTASAPDRNTVRIENEYTARANQADPGGNYKAYPDWARAALGGSGRTQR
jgi:hypothetical protein